jgi:phosphatidate cytidylyltransferase
MLKQRILTSIIGIPLVFLAVWFQTPIPWFTILVIILSAIGTYEFFHMNRQAGIKPIAFYGIAATILLVAAREPTFTEGLGTKAEGLIPAILAATIVLPLIWLLRQEPRNEAFSRWVWTLGGIGYAGFLLSYLVALRGLDDGRNWIFFVLFITFASDTAAYFVGRTWGRHKMAPKISPAKTWEGCIGGIAGAALISLAFLPAHYSTAINPVHLPVLNIWSAMLLAAAVSIFGQAGDLVESLFKRNMGAKDSGRLLPGHGGVLDRVDSVAFAGIMIYYFVWLIQ